MAHLPDFVPAPNQGGNPELYEAVLRLEFPPEPATGWLAAHPDAVGLSYGYVLFAVRR